MCILGIMRNCVIIHGGPLQEEEMTPHFLQDLYWQRWVKNELQKAGIHVEIPSMPNPWKPSYLEYKKVFEKLPLHESTVLIGHSRGCAFLVRWLGETKSSVRKLIMVAPNFVTTSSEQTVKDFYSFEIDSTIKNRVQERIIFTSDTEVQEGKDSLEMVNEKLDCEVVNLPNHGHYITEEMGGDEFPELVACVLK